MVDVDAHTPDGYVPGRGLRLSAQWSAARSTGRHHGAPNMATRCWPVLIRCKRCAASSPPLLMHDATISPPLSAAAPGWTMAALTASPSEDCASIMHRGSTAGVGSARRIAAATAVCQGSRERRAQVRASLSRIWKRALCRRPAFRQYDGPRTPRTRLVAVSLKRAGTGRSLTRRRSRTIAMHDAATSAAHC